MKPFIREDLLPVIEATPEQTTWDLSALRDGGDELLGGVTPDLGSTTREVEQVPYPAAQSMADDSGLELRWFTPAEPARAVIVSIHGGGYVCGRACFDDEKNAEMAARFGAVVVSPDYRLAPEFPFPAGVEDCVTALGVAGKRAHDLGVPLYVFGDSAGAGSAYYAAMMYGELRDCEDTASVPLSGMILLEPCLDPRTDTESFVTYADGPVWTRRAAVTAWEHTAPTEKARAVLVDMLENPEHLEACARALIIVNPADPLRDEGIRLATALADAGVPAELHMYAGTFHGALSVLGNPIWLDVQHQIERFIS